MTTLQMHRRIRELDGLIEMEEYACERDQRRSRETMNLYKAERRMLKKKLDDFMNDPMTQACGCF